MAFAPDLEYLSPHFDRLTPAIEAALGYTGGTHTLQHVRAAVADGQLQFWPTQDSFVITRLVTAPTGQKSCHVFLAGGTLTDLTPFEPILMDWARSQGCTVATCLGRHGWSRTFLTRTAGWTPALTQYVKEL